MDIWTDSEWYGSQRRWRVRLAQSVDRSSGSGTYSLVAPPTCTRGLLTAITAAVLVHVSAFTLLRPTLHQYDEPPRTAPLALEIVLPAVLAPVRPSPAVHTEPRQPAKARHMVTLPAQPQTTARPVTKPEPEHRAQAPHRHSVPRQPAPSASVASPAPPAPLVKTAEPSTPPVKQVATQPSDEPVSEAHADADYLHNPPPVYPDFAQSRGWAGRVLLKVHVLASGHPDHVELQQTCGHRLLDEAAQHAVQGWAFVPAKRGATPIDSWVSVPIDFKLGQ